MSTLIAIIVWGGVMGKSHYRAGLIMPRLVVAVVVVVVVVAGINSTGADSSSGS